MSSAKNILKNITSIEEIFPIYIELYFSESKRSNEFWNLLSSSTECFIFGGFIVDFLKRKRAHRDIDIVINAFDNQIIKLINQYKGIQNSFGGFKITIDRVNIDIWAIKDTWAIRKMNYLDFDLFSILPSTSFFNSTSIVFSIQEKKLIYHKKFLDYINRNTLDILFEDNPYPELCILKTYQNYCEGANLSNQLKYYVVEKFESNYKKFDTAQIRHFGEIKYTGDELLNFHKEIEKQINKTRKTTNNQVCAKQYVLF